MSFTDWFPLPEQFGPTVHFVVSLALLVLVAVIYKLISRSIASAAKRLELDPHIENSFRLILRVLTGLIAITIAFAMFELPTEWFVGSSALVGAAIGFGSSQTINNVVAGFVVIISRPFRVKDYVKIGDAEGQVEEITINYTKLYTPSFNLLEVPNVQVINSRVLNCTHEGFIKYTFSLSFPHSVTNEAVTKKCLEPAIEEFYRKHGDALVRKPEYFFETIGIAGRSYKLRIFVPRGEAKTLYSVQSELTEMIMTLWDKQRVST